MGFSYFNPYKNKECESSRFFDKYPIIRSIFNIDYQIDQLTECLRSQKININKYEALQLLDVYIRSCNNIIIMSPVTDSINGLKSLYIIIGNKEYPQELSDEDIMNINTNIKVIDDLSFIRFKNESLESICYYTSIIAKEYNIFINELRNTLLNIYNTNEGNIFSISGIMNIDNRYFNIRYAGIPDDIGQDSFIINSNLISYPGKIENNIGIIEKTFEETQKFKDFIKNKQADKKD